jgi:hypothetical protein
MVPKLREAFAKVETLSEEEQEAVAARIIETLDAEERVWDELFSRPQVLAELKKMADEALEADRRGETLPLDELL